MAINKLIPTEIYLPHFTIFVEFVKAEDMASDGADAEFDYDTDEKGVSTGTISIKKTLSKKEQLAAFAHEMQHAMVDYIDVLCMYERARRGKGKK